MAFSIIQTTATGSTNAFPINFTLGFNNRNEVTCQVNDEVDGLGDPVYRSLDWVNDGLVNVLPATLIPAATKVVFKRTVSKTALAHDYANGEAIDEINLDESNKQNLMAIHELFDGRFTSAFQQDLDMGTHKIKNLVDGIDPQDAVTFNQLNNLSGGAGNGLYLDVTGTQGQDDSLLWDTTAVKFIRRSLAYLKTQLGLSGITAFGSSLIAAANDTAARAILGAGTGNGDMLSATYDPANIAQQVVGTTAVQTLTNKTIDLTDNTLTGTLAEFNAAISDGDIPTVTSWVAYTPTFTGLGTATGISFFSRRVGDTLEVRGKFTSGTSTATEARITMGFNGTNNNVTSDATKVPSIQLAGTGVYSVASAPLITALIESSVGYLTFGLNGAANAGLTKINGNALVASGNAISFTAAIPISGW